MLNAWLATEDPRGGGGEAAVVAGGGGAAAISEHEHIKQLDQQGYNRGRREDCQPANQPGHPKIATSTLFFASPKHLRGSYVEIMSSM